MNAFRRSPYQHFEANNLASGSIHKVAVVGNFLTILTYTGTDDLYISFGGEPFQKLPKAKSIELPADEEFLDLRFKQESGAAQSFTFAISSGRIYDNSVIFSGTLAVDPVPATMATPAAAAVTDSAAIAVAADTDTQAVLLQNVGGNDVWIGDANVAPASNRGIKLAPGDSLVLETKAAIYGRCAAGLTSTLAILRTYKA